MSAAVLAVQGYTCWPRRCARRMKVRSSLVCSTLQTGQALVGLPQPTKGQVATLAHWLARDGPFRFL